MAQQEHLRDVEELEQQFRSDTSPEVFIPLGEAYLRRGYPTKAIEVCRKGLKRGESVRGQLVLAQAYFDASTKKRAFLKQASDEVEGLISRNPDMWEGHRLRGEIAIENDDIQGAIKALKRAHELNPDHPHARMLLQSLGVEVTDPPPGGDTFYLNVETGFVPPQDDSLFAALRDIAIFLAVFLAGVTWFAQGSINERKVRALVMLGRSQQNLDTFQGLKRSSKIYETIRKEFDANHPFALMHLAEVHYSLWRYHERKPAHLAKFNDYFALLNKHNEKGFLEYLANYQALVALISYNSGQKMLREGKLSEAKNVFKNARAHMKSMLQQLPIHPRVNLMYGLLHEAGLMNRHARAHLKRAAELGWNSPMYKQRLADHYLLTRSFAAAHGQYQSTQEMGRQSVNLVNSFLVAPDKQKNENCWVDPPLLFGDGAGVKKGLQLNTVDMLSESLLAAVRAEALSQCPFHPYFRKKYKAVPYYLRARIGDVLSVLDSGVGMSVGFELAAELTKHAKKVEKAGNMSPHIKAWYNFAMAKSEYFKFNNAKAKEWNDKALAIAPYEPFFHSLKGLIDIRDKKYDDAATSFKKAYGMAPYLMQTYIESINALLDVKEDDKYTQGKIAASMLEIMKSNFGEHSDYLFLMGRLAANNDEGDKAEKLWMKALDDQKAPYYGDHYFANIKMGLLFMARAKAHTEKRRYKKSEYPELLKSFKKNEKKIRANIKRDVVAKEVEKANKLLDKFLAKLKDDMTIAAKDCKYYIGSLREAIYEDAGSYFQTAMTSRPGSVISRLQTGLIYIGSKRWNDSVGHFMVAAAGYLRDLDYKGATTAYNHLAGAIASSVDVKPRKKRKEKAEKVKKKFSFLAAAELRKSYLKIATAKDSKKKKKLKPNKKKHLVNTLNTIVTVLEKTKLPNPVKDYIEELKGDATLVKDKGIVAWYKVYRKRLIAAKSGKKGKRRRRRRRRR